MKKHVMPLIISVFLVNLAGSLPIRAQDEASTKIRITITEDDKVTTDTTFELSEGQDPEMIKKIVSHLAGGDLHARHMSKDNKMVWKGSGEDMMSGINPDSIREAHKDANILVIKNKDGEITVKELEGEDMKEHKVIIKSDGDCEDIEKEIEVFVQGSDDMKWVEKEDEKEKIKVYVIDKGGDDVKVVKKKVRVEIEEEDEKIPEKNQE
jgi:hypothetical protein